jgi:uncharacterized membrane protein
MPGYHERFAGTEHFGAAWALASLLLTGMTLLWLVTPVLITATYLWWRSRRPELKGQPLSQPLIADDPSAFELLRRRYVVGEIDTPTFEEMTEQLLLSERAEEQPLQLARYDRYLRRERWSGERRDVLL